MGKRRAETILIPAFTEETKKNLEKRLASNNKTAPKKRKNELGQLLRAYTKLAYPYNYETRIEKTLSEFEILEVRDDIIYIEQRYKDDTRIKTVVIDKSFEDWLDKLKLPLDAATLYMYMGQVSDEEATKLLKHNHLNMNLTLCLYPFVITDMNNSIEDKDYALSENSTEKIQELIEGVYGKGNVWIPGVVMPVEETETKSKDLLRRAHEFFSGSPEIKLNKKYGVQKNKKKSDFFPLCIPFVVKNEFNSSVYTLEQLYGGKSINEIKNLTYIVDKIRFLSDYDEPQNKHEAIDIDVDKMTFEEYILSPETNAEFSIDTSGLKEILTDEIKIQKGQGVLFFYGWDRYEEIVSNIREIEEENEAHEMRYFTFDRGVSYLDQFEEYFENHKTASDIVAYLDALGMHISELCGEDLDKLPDDEKENIVIFIDYINENYYQTIYKTMIDKHAEVLQIFDIAEYYKFEMTAESMKEDLANIDADLVEEAQKLVKKMWDEKHKQVFTFTISKGIEVVEEQIWKYNKNTCSKANEALYITLTHFCAAMMMCGGSLAVRTFVEKTREELYGIIGRNWDWRPCTKEETKISYTRLPNGAYLEPDKNTVFTEITKE